MIHLTFHLTSPHLTSPHLTSHHLTSPQTPPTNPRSRRPPLFPTAWAKTPRQAHAGTQERGGWRRRRRRKGSSVVVGPIISRLAVKKNIIIHIIFFVFCFCKELKLVCVCHFFCFAFSCLGVGSYLLPIYDTAT